MNARLKLLDHLRLIRNIKTTGTISPSSSTLINDLLAPIDFAKARCLVELGPGNGCITRRILQRMHADCILVCLEVNNDFVAQLNAFNDSRLKVYNACASDIGRILEQLRIDNVDHVVSSLPLAIMDKEVVLSVLASVHATLRPGGLFLQYQYSLNDWQEIRSVFNHSRVRFTIRNMPPAFIYVCTR